MNSNFILPLGTTLFVLWVMRRMVPGYFFKLGTAYEDREDFGNAERMFLTVLRIESWISRFGGDKRGLAIAYESLGALYKRKGTTDVASEMLLKAMDICEQM